MNIYKFQNERYYSAPLIDIQEKFCGKNVSLAHSKNSNLNSRRDYESLFFIFRHGSKEEIP